MRYFTDGAGHIARVHTDAPFGTEFNAARAQTYNAKRDTWVDVLALTIRLRYSGDWEPCSEAAAEALVHQAIGARLT